MITYLSITNRTYEWERVYKLLFINIFYYIFLSRMRDHIKIF